MVNSAMKPMGCRLHFINDFSEAKAPLTIDLLTDQAFECQLLQGGTSVLAFLNNYDLHLIDCIKAGAGRKTQFAHHI